MKDESTTEEWRQILTEGKHGVFLERHVLRRLPSAPRCKLCNAPFAGGGGILDFTALGDDVNVAARLASSARSGEILLSDAAREASRLGTDGLERRSLELKGKSQPVQVWSIWVQQPAKAGVAEGGS